MGIGDAGDEINRANRANRLRAERMWRKGSVTKVDNAHNPPLAWVSDGSQTRRMPSTIAGLAVGDVVFFNDQKDPFVHGRVNPRGGSVPNIWTCTSLRPGDTTWTSTYGDVRTLGTQAARHIARGGLSTEPNVLSLIQVYEPPDGDDLSASQTVRWDIDLTGWWSIPAGENRDKFSMPLFGDWNFSWYVVPRDWWSPGDPSMLAVTDGAASPNANGILLDPSTIGLDGYERIFLRVEFNPTTGACEAWLSTINDVTFNLVSQGTATFATTTPGAGVQFDGDNQMTEPPYDGWAPMVIHGVTVRQPANGAVVQSFQVNNIDAARPIYVPDQDSPSYQMIGGSLVSQSSPFYQSYDSDYVWSPRGAAIFIGSDEENGNIPIWTDGGDLVDPVIAWSDYRRPGKVFIMEGVQPADFVTDWFGAFILAVCDRQTAAAVDSDGWPVNWWPFGSLIT